jgi:outer membrane protein
MGDRRGRVRWELWAALVAATLWVGCASSPGINPKGQIGVVDPSRVLNETEAGKKVKESLNAFMKNRQSLIELEEKELKRMEDDLIKQASVLSATAKREREEQFRRRMMEYQQKVGELNREVQEKQRDVSENFRGRVEKVVAKVAQQLGLLVVLEKGKGAPTLFNDSSLDITGPVIEEFNKGGY